MNKISIDQNIFKKGKLDIAKIYCQIYEWSFHGYKVAKQVSDSDLGLYIIYLIGIY